MHVPVRCGSVLLLCRHRVHGSVVVSGSVVVVVVVVIVVAVKVRL